MGWSRQDGKSRAPRIAVAAMAVFATMASLLMVVASPVVDEAEAADASAFQAGLIVSDANFYDGGAMSASQVQSFLDGQMRQCASGYTCLRGYAQSTPTMAANAYCGAIQGQGSESAASIIARIGAACNISQRFLLVLLQKEQSLVTSTAPVQRQFDRATGFACPDTAPCDSSYGGFFYQVYYAARQFNVYKRFPTSYNHQPAAWNNVLFHPNSACGSSRVYVQNSATAGLYNYTPYQPNGAALANLYGTGDSCSAYGNRNTWRMWTDWFGDPSRAQAAAFVRNASTGQVYLVADGRKYYVPDPALFTHFAPLYNVETRDASYLGSLPTGANLSNVIRGPNGAVYLVRDGARYYFSSCADITAWGYSCGDSAYLSNDQITRLVSGGNVQMTVRVADGSTWLVQSGSRRQLADPALPQQFGYPAASLSLSRGALDHLPIGYPLVAAGTIVRSDSRVENRIVTQGGTFSGSSATLGLSFLWNAPAFANRSLELMPATLGALPVRFADSSGSYVVSDLGIVAIDRTQYGSTAFAQVPAGTAQALPGAGSVSGPHLMIEYGSSVTYLVTQGRRILVLDATHLAQLRATFNPPSTIWRVARGAVTALPEASALPDGQLVRGSGPAVYLMDGSNGIHIGSLEYAAAMGLSTSVRVVAQDVVDRMYSRQGTMNDFGVVCNGTSYLAAGGTLHPYANQSVRDAWNRSEITLGSLCSRLPIGAPVDRFVVEPNGRTYFVENGQLRYVPTGAIYTSLGGTATNRTAISAAMAQMLPRGPEARAAIQTGQLVHAAGDGRVWVVDGNRLLHLGQFSVSSALGLGASPLQVDASQIAAVTSRGTLYTSLVVCGTVGYAAIGGRLLPMTDAVRASYPAGAFTQLSPSLCSMLQVSSTSMTQMVRGSDGRVYWVQDGRRHWLGAAAYQRLGGPALLRDIDDSIFLSIPVGETWTT